jgi:hypothetical protein
MLPQDVGAHETMTEAFNLHSNKRQTGDARMGITRLGSKGIVLALGIVSVVLAASLIIAVRTYNMEITQRDNQISQLNTWLQGNLTEISSLYGQVAFYRGDNDFLQGELLSFGANMSDALRTIDELEAPILINISLRGSDMRPLNQTQYLQVSGYIVNLHQKTAYQSQIRAIAYQGQVLAFDTRINLGTITGENFTLVDARVYYSGENLTSWDFQLYWTAVNPSP